MDHRPDDNDPRIPDALAGGLRRLQGGRRAAWNADDPVLAAVGRGARRPWRVVGWSSGLVAAAGLAVAAVVWFANPGSQNPAWSGIAHSAPASPVTMLDAYRLRLALDRSDSPGDKWDANDDGVVNGSDVDALAAAAVRLGEASS